MKSTRSTIPTPRWHPRARAAAWAAALVLAAGACTDRQDAGLPTAPDLDGPGIRYTVAATSSTYTTDADVDQGTLVSVNHDAPNSNQLQLNTSSGTFPFIWVALSVRCTIAKINTATGAILGEYRTIADNVGCNQSSRTTVAIDGSVWVGHRGPGGVTHVGLAELNQCVDRNGNSTIETSTGYGDVKPWTGGSPSPVANAQDECILHHVDTDALGFGDTRHMSIDASNKLWVGSYVSRRFVRVDGTTGAVDSPVRTGLACGGYGGLIDSSGVIWSANGSGFGLLRWDPNAPDAPGVNPRCVGVSNYGLAVDQNGWIWATDLGPNIYKISADGNTILGPFSHGASNAQGLAVDAGGDVWVSSSLFCGGGCTIGHLKNNGTFVGSVPNPSGAGSTGISVDAAVKIWSANLNSHTATRIDPAAGPLGADAVTPVGAVDLVVNFPAGPGGRPLPSPYNYSDMTGAQLFGSTAPQGSWTVTQDGGSPGTPWSTIGWNSEPQGFVPAGGSITVEARSADTEAALGSQSYAAVTNGGALTLTGQFIQVRVTIKAAPDGTSPVLSDISIRSVQDTGAPFCAITATGTNGSGQKYIQVTTRDTESGLASVNVTRATNLTAVVPPFTPGTTADVVVTATKINQSLSSQLQLTVSDVAGNVTVCDPVDVTVGREAGTPVSTTLTGIPAAEHWIEVHNGTPGLTNLAVRVNGTRWQVAGLKPGETRTLDVARAMQGSNNTVVLTPTGRPGGSAWVLVRD